MYGSFSNFNEIKEYSCLLYPNSGFGMELSLPNVISRYNLSFFFQYVLNLAIVESFAYILIGQYQF